MIVLEAVLFTVLLCILAYSGYTDCASSQIPNTPVLISGCIAAIVDSIYYIGFAGIYLRTFVVNLILIVIVSVIFYAYHLWAAGDCKLMLVVAICIPGRFYSFWDIGTVPAFVIFILIFSFAFLYVIAESILLGLKNKNLLQLSFRDIDYTQVLLSYFSMVSAVMIVNWGVWRIFEKSLNNNLILSMAVSFLVVLTLSQLRNRMSKRGLLYTMVAGWSTVFILILTKQYHFELTADFKSWLIVLSLMLLRMIAEKYNYKVIPTHSVKCGQILSFGTVLAFRTSKVQGLPASSTEDLRSRITQSEVDSIKRWELSKFGKPYVVIVRKIPFAIFIGIGTILFIVLEVAMQ